MASRALEIDPKKATTSDPDVQPGRSQPIEQSAIAAKIDPKKATTSDSDVQPGRSEPIEQSIIAARAYECWQERGCPVGSDQEDWFRAEQELKSQTSTDLLTPPSALAFETALPAAVSR